LYLPFPQQFLQKVTLKFAFSRLEELLLTSVPAYIVFVQCTR